MIRRSIIHKNTRNITVDAELPVKHVYNVIGQSKNRIYDIAVRKESRV